MWRHLILFLMVQSVHSKKNVLFLVSDDMRPQINAWEGPDFPSPVHPKMHTPHLDALAARSLLLKRAYVQQAVCNPSRTSLLTGRRPDTTHVTNNENYFRIVGGNFTTIPEYFKRNGYTSVGMGKIFHPGKASGHDDPISWSEPYYHAPNYKHYDIDLSWRAVSKSERKERELPDIQIAEYAIKTLKILSENPDKPFFVAVGIHKPHLPFVFPEEFLDFYPEHEIRCPDNQYAPVGMPEIAWYTCTGLFSMKDIKKLNVSGNINTTLPEESVKTLRRAYYSALSYTDSLIGDVIKALDDLGLKENTIVSFFGDHGWELGEHGEWCKQSNFENAVHAPMMVHIPGLTDNGIVTEQLTEYVDLFPTLVEAAGLPPLTLCPDNSTQTAVCREGTSLMPLISDPQNTNWKTRVFSQFPRKGYTSDGEEEHYMGYTMRTDQFRYTEWVKYSGPPDYKPSWDINKGTELYDHSFDLEENHNLAGFRDYRQIQEELSKMLHDGWRGAIPDEQSDNAFKVNEFDVLIEDEFAIKDGKTEGDLVMKENERHHEGHVNPKFDIL